MTPQEWADAVTADLTAAGFPVEPLSIEVPLPIIRAKLSFNEKHRLLKHSTTPPASRRIYAEGVLFVPPEWRA